MTPILRLCPDYIDQLAVLDPVHASVLGIGADYGAATDYSPDGDAARADLIRATLAALGRLPVTSEADRQAADHLRERLQAEEAWHASGEPLRLLRAPLVVRYLGWPAQAITYKLGERAWLAARDEARGRPGFDLKRWHTAALDLGPIGLGGLAEALRCAG